MHGPFSTRFWSVQYLFESRLTSVLLKRSGVKRTVHGSFFWRILYVSILHLTLESTVLIKVYRLVSSAAVLGECGLE